ncbi:1466_t:CDS:2 [Paraglomus brasilianum]|uniref:1466_t:CDS:1 n=1 Tax=Paraglomus brasilianum TaxID=144538 RepID=A0A9N8VJ15_9GLOM|nr:1466_t:CDS:2 [Paraglomus brasilianum]
MELKKKRGSHIIRRELNVDMDTGSESDNEMDANSAGMMISGGRRWNTSKETKDDKTFMHPGNWLTMIEKRCLDVNGSHNMISGDYDVNSNLQAADNMNWISLPTPGLFGLDQDLVSPLDSVAPSLSFSEDYSTPGPSEPPFTPEQYTIHSVDDESNEQATNGPYVIGTATDVITEAALESLIPLAELICNNYPGQISCGVGNEYEVQEMDRAAEEMMEYIVADDDDEDIMNTVSNNNAWNNFVDASNTL